MVMVVLETDRARYGVPASRIAEVLPAPVLRSLPGTPPWVAGVFNYHGELVPVVDFSMLLTGRPAPALWSTRILLVNFQPHGKSHPVRLGLLAEHATETIACEREELHPASVRGNDAPYAGDILIRPGRLIQGLDIDRLLSAEVQEQLFSSAGVAG